MLGTGLWMRLRVIANQLARVESLETDPRVEAAEPLSTLELLIVPQGSRQTDEKFDFNTVFTRPRLSWQYRLVKELTRCK